MISKKLVYKLTVLSILPVIISMILFGSISYMLYKEQFINQRIDEAKSLVLLSTEEIKNPLYFVQLDKLNAIIGNIHENPNVVAVFVLDAGGKVITDGTNENRFYGKTFTDNFSERSIISRESIVVIENDVLRISSPVVLNEKIGTIMIDFSLKESDIVLTNLIILLGVIGSIIVIVISFINFYISNSISKTVIELRDATNEVAKGNFNIKIEKKTNDEIGELAGTFNKMAEDLKKSNETLKKSLEEKEVLLREIHHRVKNNMQIVSSLLMLQSENIEDKKYRDVFIDSQNRIHAMALIHEKLYQSTSIAQINLKEYIGGIVSNIFESYGNKSNIKIDINIENILLNIDYAVPCGLIINEILTNSFKYAFPDGRPGIITIIVKLNDNNMIQILIRDNGIGIPKDMDIRNTKSLGLRLITGLAESQLHGEIILNREGGTEFQINFRQAK